MDILYAEQKQKALIRRIYYLVRVGPFYLSVSNDGSVVDAVDRLICYRYHCIVLKHSHLSRPLLLVLLRMFTILVPLSSLILDSFLAALEFCISILIINLDHKLDWIKLG